MSTVSLSWNSFRNLSRDHELDGFLEMAAEEKRKQNAPQGGNPVAHFAMRASLEAAGA